MPYREPASNLVEHTLSPEDRGEVARLNEVMDAFGAQIVTHEWGGPTWFSIHAVDYGAPLSRHGSVADLRNAVDGWRASVEREQGAEHEF